MRAVDAVLDAAGASVPRVMERVERRMAEVSVDHGAALARHAGETIAAGGKRLRPLLVCLAAGVPPPESDSLVFAGVAVELVHAATLVHDDVLDASALRRGRPTVVAAGGRRMATATGDLLFSRAFAELAHGALGGCRAGALARELRARPGRADATGRCMAGGCDRRALPRSMPAEDGGPVSRRMRARRARGRWPDRCSGHVRRADWARLPDPRRRARRLRACQSERASRRVPICSTARALCR